MSAPQNRCRVAARTHTLNTFILLPSSHLHPATRGRIFNASKLVVRIVISTYWDALTHAPVQRERGRFGWFRWFTSLSQRFGSSVATTFSSASSWGGTYRAQHRTWRKTHYTTLNRTILRSKLLPHLAPQMRVCSPYLFFRFLYFC